MRWLGLSGGVLILALVRSPPHPDLPVAPGLARSPFDDVVAVFAEGVSAAPCRVVSGGPAATSVDEEDCVVP